jgi:hypothetical protein
MKKICKSYSLHVFYEALVNYYSVFHRFSQAKFACGDSVLGTRDFLELASKNGACCKSSQNWLENNHLATLI